MSNHRPGNSVPARLALLALLSLSTPAWAVEDSSALWLGVAKNGDLGTAPGTPWIYTLQSEYRLFDALEGVRQALGRVGVGHRFDNGVRLWLRGDYYQTHAPDRGTVEEFRSQQLLYLPLGDWGATRILFRGLLEQRWLDRADGTGWRLRPQLRFERASKRLDGVTWVGWTEPFFDLRNTDWVDTGWNQNRLFVGARIALDNGLNLETGYQHQWLNPGERRAAVSHTAVFRLRLR